MPDEMNAIEITGPGGPDVLRQVRRPVPRPAHDEVLIRVAAAGVNRPDCIQRAGGYPPPPGASDLPGLEVAGEIVARGAGVSQWKEGDRVMALVAGGGYAEYCAAPAPQCLPVPDGYDMVKAAAVPETFFTVWTNVFDRGRLQGGESFLVHGGSSGIGTTAIQLAKRFGARVFATAGSAEKCDACVKLGAERAINYREEDFVEVVKELTGGDGVNLILDMVGGDYFRRNVKALAVEGRLVQIAFLDTPKVEFDFTPMMLKRLTLTGSTLRPRSVQQKAEIAEALAEHVLPLLASGAVAPVIDTVLPIAEAAKAHEKMEASTHIGKIMLEV
ncbi:NAD(P)H-quinone oxidoreductase [Minwuia thermotolerans]|uniref:NAD(P)H-quinone oxidoreductase n=1 Tax=Minwuia thermotolerans TaxID=2056226 RepID=A0A2M9FYG3_9PROT|nr:NAD(P)H-quinone oxidoreductase [Minwuia thermotolerans]